MLDSFIGASPFAERARKILPALALNRETIIITGERGAGKAFLAAHVHARSGVALPIDALNCMIATERTRRLDLLGGEPPDLTTTKRSMLESATTVVLKHVDHAGAFLQDQLAEAIGSRRVTRLSGIGDHAVEARIILTLRKPARVLRTEGRISDALFECLRSCRAIHVPPLRERAEDIPLLAGYYYERFRARLDGLPKSPQLLPRRREVWADIGPALGGMLREQKWEDNVRDLAAYVRSLLAFEEDPVHREKLELMKMLTMLEQGSEFSLEKSMAVIRRSIIERAVEKQKGHQGKTAELLGLSDREIRRKTVR